MNRFDRASSRQGAHSWESCGCLVPTDAVTGDAALNFLKEFLKSARKKSVSPVSHWVPCFASPCKMQTLVDAGPVDLHVDCVPDPSA